MKKVYQFLSCKVSVWSGGKISRRTTRVDSMPSVPFMVFIWTGRKNLYYKQLEKCCRWTNVLQVLVEGISLNWMKTIFTETKMIFIPEEHRSCVRIFPSDLENLGKVYLESSHRIVPMSLRSLSTRSTASSRVNLFMSTKSEIYLDSSAILTIKYCDVAVHLETKQIYSLSSDFSHRREHKNWEPSSSTWAVEKERILMKPSVMSRLVPGTRYKNCLDDAGIGCAVWS